jgi:hypothetical protein
MRFISCTRELTRKQLAGQLLSRIGLFQSMWWDLSYDLVLVEYEGIHSLLVHMHQSLTSLSISTCLYKSIPSIVYRSVCHVMKGSLSLLFFFFFEVTYSDERKQLAGRLLSRIDIFTMKKIIEFRGVDPSPNLPQKSRIKILTAGNTYF